jgi:hypothetical protein
MIYGKKAYQDPPAKFQVGDKVRFITPEDEEQKGCFVVEQSDHCFTWVGEFRFGIPNSQLRRVRKAKNQTKEGSSV